MEVWTGDGVETEVGVVEVGGLVVVAVVVVVVVVDPACAVVVDAEEGVLTVEVLGPGVAVLPSGMVEGRPDVLVVGVSGTVVLSLASGHDQLTGTRGDSPATQ
jgi:hypothetical protein